MTPPSWNQVLPIGALLEMLKRFEAEAKGSSDDEVKEWIQYAGRVFALTNDPILGLETLCCAVELKRDIPEEVIDWWVKGVTSYLKANGKGGLDKHLRLTSTPGKDSALRAHYLKKRDFLCMCDMFFLCSLGASVREAADVVAAAMNRTQWNQSGLKLKTLSADTLEDVYRKKWHCRVSEKDKQSVRAWASYTVRSYIDLRFPKEAKALIPKSVMERARGIRGRSERSSAIARAQAAPRDKKK